MVINNSTLLNFINQGLDVAKAIPKYFSKYSNRIFTNHQHLVLIVLKQKLRSTWRDLIELLKISSIPKVLRLKRIPHFTTLIKFSKRISPILVNKLLAYSAKLSKPKKLKLGVDATGLALDNASRYYQVRLAVKRRRKSVIQVTACGLMDSLLVSSAQLNKYKSVRNNNFLPVVKKSAKLGEVEFVTADKGYDFNDNHKYVLQELKTNSYIKVREKMMGKRSAIRRRALREFDEEIYHQRSKIETIFSMIKRKYGDALRGKSTKTQIQEGYHKLLTHNLDRLCKLFLGLLEGFIRAAQMSSAKRFEFLTYRVYKTKIQVN